MYKFVDTNQATRSTPLPSEALLCLRKKTFLFGLTMNRKCCGLAVSLQ